MRILITLSTLLALTACSETIEDNELNNEKIMGTVVSIKRTHDMNWQGAGNIASSGAASVGNVATGGMFSNWWKTNSATSSDTNTEDGVSYIIQTEEGQRITVQTNGNRVYYPGDEVMVVRNGVGFADVYPRDLTHRHPGGL